MSLKVWVLNCGRLMNFIFNRKKLCQMSFDIEIIFFSAFSLNLEDRDM